MNRRRRYEDGKGEGRAAMTVYVDDMQAKVGRMVMCHMIGDTDEELHAMADSIGVERRWFQKPGTPTRHYDIALAKRALAVQAGAVEISQRQAACMTGRRRVTGELGNPVDAIAWRLSKVKRALQAPAPIPVGVSYDPSAHVFFTSTGPLGYRFMAEWEARACEFPQASQVTPASGVQVATEGQQP
jgi:hypothetical protein